MGHDRLESARLRAEPLGPAHRDGLATMLGDPRVGATLGGTATPDQVDAHLAAMTRHWDRHGFGWYGWLDRDAGTLVARGGPRCARIAATSSPTIAARAGSAGMPAKRRIEEAARRLADDVCLRAGRVLERGDERADVEREPVGREPEAVLLQRDQLRAVHQVPEGAVQDAVAERVTEIADDDRLHVGLALLQFGEVLLDGVIHHERNSAMAALDAAAHGQRRGRDQLARSRVESEPPQAVQDRATRTGGRVGNKAQRRTVARSAATASSAPGTGVSST